MTTDANATSLDAVSLDDAGDPQDVAADGGREHVPDELAGQVVLAQGREVDRSVEHCEYALPSPRSEHEAPGHDHEAADEEGQRAGQTAVLGHEGAGVDLRHEHGQQSEAQDQASPSDPGAVRGAPGPSRGAPCLVDYEPGEVSVPSAKRTICLGMTWWRRPE